MPRKSIPMDYTEEETIARAETALKRMLATPHRPHSEMKVGKSRANVARHKAPPDLLQKSSKPKTRKPGQ
jgi:hypothetical protein